jgi:hypothetical protein
MGLQLHPPADGTGTMYNMEPYIVNFSKILIQIYNVKFSP